MKKRITKFAVYLSRCTVVLTNLVLRKMRIHARVVNCILQNTLIWGVQNIILLLLGIAIEIRMPIWKSRRFIFSGSVRTQMLSSGFRTYYSHWSSRYALNCERCVWKFTRVYIFTSICLHVHIYSKRSCLFKANLVDAEVTSVGTVLVSLLFTLNRWTGKFCRYYSFKLW